MVPKPLLLSQVRYAWGTPARCLTSSDQGPPYPLPRMIPGPPFFHPENPFPPPYRLKAAPLLYRYLTIPWTIINRVERLPHSTTGFRNRFKMGFDYKIASAADELTATMKRRTGTWDEGDQAKQPSRQSPGRCWNRFRRKNHGQDASNCCKSIQRPES
jgi:hypothetical protein